MAAMTRNNCERILQAIKREHDTFRLMLKGVVLDLKTCEVYEGVSDADQADTFDQ